MMTLFQKPAASDKPREPMPDFFSWYAREKHGMPEGWRWVRLNLSESDAPPGTIKIEGAVMPTRTTGSEVWRRRTRGTERTLWLVRAEFDAWLGEKARTLGKCVRCWGSGEVWSRISVNKPTEYQTCPACGGSGKFGGAE